MIFTHFRSSLIRGIRYSTTASNAATTIVPLPRGKIQDVESFMKAIGRNCEEVANKFESWDKLFTTNSQIMKKEMGIETKQRKYILSWVERYRKGIDPYSIPLPRPKKK
ncbi:IGR protein motif-domain-containing protein [Cokeromyces recurvatus]|uniref:IGR protein motif-domain-containing protein n=1 Tax=Cokeromyces recurvatus TaxID=90255 RepID=UPI00221EB01C|nr:IGR protein motif-domain-containing protein [Cokeromyces recurvatus]KAI7907308.1 IGR protein motif-domain-containing protein [Cokeromyces recurvatus]